MIHVGDCLDVMRAMPEGGVTAIVTDPPYGLEFMGKGWDKVLPPVEVWREALRVLRPGGHALIFGGTRTYHRLACAVEDAGFEVRDCLMWLYGQGFPKSMDVSKAIDKAAGAEREVVGRGSSGRTAIGGTGDRALSGTDGTPGHDITAPATAAAAAWSGYGTALKPAWEPILLARKPLVGTVERNCREHGTGALNIDGCRIGTDGGRWPANLILDPEAAALLDEQAPDKGQAAPLKETGRARPGHGRLGEMGPPVACEPHDAPGGASRFFFVACEDDIEWLGRNLNLWPADSARPCLSLQSEAVASALARAVNAALPEGMQSSVSKAPSTNATPSESRRIVESAIEAITLSASEFWQDSPHARSIPSHSPAQFVVRRVQIGTMTITLDHWRSDGSADPITFSITQSSSAPGAKDYEPSVETERFRYCAKASKADRGEGNTHPTVKPVELMRWLVRLVKGPVDNLILDPFGGSGTTGVACRLEGVPFLLIERDPAYAEIIKRRLAE